MFIETKYVYSASTISLRILFVNSTLLRMALHLIISYLLVSCYLHQVPLRKTGERLTRLWGALSSILFLEYVFYFDAPAELD